MVDTFILCSQVKDFGFYDVVLDFLILDAFDDLESPPASVVSIIQNRWLSQSVKETVSGTRLVVSTNLYSCLDTFVVLTPVRMDLYLPHI